MTPLARYQKDLTRIRTLGQRAATHAMCFADCSGFITSLFAWVNQQNGSAFTSWQAGQPIAIPEAGCFDPAGGCQLPNSNNYYKFFTQPGHGFQAVALADIQPGDLLAWANTGSPTDSGHIMLVAAVADAPCDPSGQTKQIVVIDESSGHTQDTRSNGKGALGLGIIVLSTNNSQTQLQFFWTVVNFCAQPPKPQPGAVAIGRALAGQAG
ncbi:MAG: hypothetical protein RL748_1817 [Pseudomonadota bacterium]